MNKETKDILKKIEEINWSWEIYKILGYRITEDKSNEESLNEGMMDIFKEIFQEELKK